MLTHSLHHVTNPPLTHSLKSLKATTNSTNSLTHLTTNSLTHSLAHSLTHQLLTHSLYYYVPPLTRPLTD